MNLHPRLVSCRTCISYQARNILLTICIIILFISCAPAQSYYPGGLGNGSLIVWLNAGNNASITQVAGAVSQWNGLSGHAYNFAQGTASRRPAYSAAGGPSGRPALVFTSTSINYLGRASMAAAIAYTPGVSSFAVASFNASTTAQGFERIYDFGNGTASDNIWMGRYGTTANLGYESRIAATVAQTYTTTGSYIVNGTNSIYEAIQQSGATGGNSAVGFYKAGTPHAANGSLGSAVTSVPNTVARTVDYIGRSNWAADDYFSGSMSEILFYNTAMNTTQRTILEDYLSAAWGLGVSATYYTPPASTYYSNLVGIGYTSAGDLFLSDINGSTDGLGFTSTSGATGFLNTAGYVMAAHNQQTNSILSGVTITGVGGGLNRWNRSWNMQKTGGNSSGLISFNFNFSDYNGTAPTSTYSYGLLYNATDGSFATGTNKLVTLSGNSVAGNIVTLTAAGTQLAAGYYTLVWSTSFLLPVSLTSFSAVRNDANSLLQWMASDITASSYDVQRATDAIHFTTLGSVAANTGGPYHFTDPAPAPGINYYRLKINGAQGTVAYSIVYAIDFGLQPGAAIRIYPDPVGDALHIAGVEAGSSISIRILDFSGRVVKNIPWSVPATTGIPMTGLSRGFYIADISTGAGVYRSTFIKR